MYITMKVVSLAFKNCIVFIVQKLGLFLLLIHCCLMWTVRVRVCVCVYVLLTSFNLYYFILQYIFVWQYSVSHLGLYIEL